jgi:thiol-disulfide isomerase/thioredoxin
MVSLILQKGVSMTALVLAACLQAAVMIDNAAPASYTQAYQEAEKTGKPLMILVGADWCPGCRTMKNSVIPQLQQSGDLTDVSFAMVNPDQDRELAGKLMRGGSIPQLIVYQKTNEGWKREQITGAASVNETRGLIRRVAQRLTGR